jgi:hypothetical protein
MPSVPNPALEEFLATLGSEMVLGQVCLRRVGKGFELRHHDDAAAEAQALQLMAIDELRSIAQSTAAGAFRPLKSAPNLARGWRAHAAHPEELDRALQHLYPGCIADWFAARSPNPPVTHYREFTGRQTGMYRITTLLSDLQAAQMIHACCHPALCLKQRLWTVAGLPADPPGTKSLIPCLEPCAVLLEFARKAMRIEQEERLPLTLAASEWESVRDALEASLANPKTLSPPPPPREADFNVASNPRRQRLLLEKVLAHLAKTPPPPNPADE